MPFLSLCNLGSPNPNVWAFGGKKEKIRKKRKKKLKTSKGRLLGGPGRAFRAMFGKTFLLTTRVKTPGATGSARCLAPAGAPQKLQVPPPSPGTSWAALGCPSTGSRGFGRAPGAGTVENARAEENRALSSAPQHGSAQCCAPESGIQRTYFVHNICIIHAVYVQGIYPHGDCIYSIHMRVYLSAFRGSEYFRHFFFLLQQDLFSQLGKHLCLSEKSRSYFWRLFSPSPRAAGRARPGPCGAVCSGSVAPERPGEGVQGGGHCPPPWSLGFCPRDRCLCSPGMCPAAGHGPGWAAVGTGDRKGMGWGGMRT